MHTILVTSIPILLSWCGILTAIMTFVMMFSKLSHQRSAPTKCCCGLSCFLFWFMLFLHVPSVTWTSIVVFLLGVYNEDGKIGGRFGNLKCDPSFWKVTFRIMIAIIAFDFLIIIVLLVQGVVNTCRCLCSGIKYCCCWCCKSSNDLTNIELA